MECIGSRERTDRNGIIETETIIWNKGDSTMNETYKELTKALHNARIEQQVVDDELKYLRESFEAEIAPKKEVAKALAKTASDAKTALTEYAKLADQTGTLDADGPVQMKDMPQIKIDQVKALAWAKVNMPYAILETVDEKLLKPIAERGGQEWAIVKKIPTPYVAADLSKYVG